MEARETLAGMVSVSIDAECVCSTNGVRFALVDISALDTSVTLESRLALAHIMSRKIATLRVLHALGRELRNLALINVCAFVPVSFVTLIARAEVAAERVGAVAEHVARSVLALVHVGHVTAFASVTIVTVALRVQARAVLALAPCRVQTVVCAFDE